MFNRSVVKAMALAVAGCALALAHAGTASAQSTTVVVPYAAGGSADVAIRTIINTIEETGGQRFIVENRAGGGGVPAATHVKDSAPTGHTLLLANYATFVINPTLMRNFPFDPTIDFRPITTLFSFPLMLAVPPGVPAKSVAELVVLAKSKPGGLTFGSQGVGSAGHLLGELFATGSGTKLVHVPYKGAAQGVIDLVAGRVDMMFIGILPTKGHLESGKLRALAVTSRTRLAPLPNAPTMAEVGFPDVNTDFVWFGLTAPAKTPDSVIKNINALFAKALTSKALQDKLGAQGMSIASSTPDELVARIKADTAKFAPLVKASGATTR
ncbi:MAG: tripartite tricarboxylate transporter substrate binding protein [Rhizobiales bacterium]|nr:tripartite tricarboxylate transporter substrate binding protein [Hyphomicrobiales bacterium]